MKGYCGTYTSKESEGIYQFEFNEETGELSAADLFVSLRNPKAITYHEGYLFSIFEGDEGAGVCAINEKGEIVDSIITEKITSCYITAKDQYIYTANYHEGLFTVLTWEKNKLEVVFQDKVKDKAGCHHVFFVDDKILVPCLFLDQVLIYNQQFEKVDVLSFPKGSGPRNGVYAKENKMMFLLCELSNEIFSFEYHDGKFLVGKKATILEENETHFEQSAALRMTMDETRLIGSTRGKNIMSVLDFDLELMQILSTQGDHPRDFVLSIDNRYLVVANRDSNQLVSFQFSDGKIHKKISEINVPEGVSIAWRTAQ